MKNLKARNNSGDDWITPPELYDALNAIYNFDYDPCPYKADFDSLKLESWPGKNIFINPPYSKKSERGFHQKSIRGKSKRQNPRNAPSCEYRNKDIS